MVEIRKANMSDFLEIVKITRETIRKVYPHYYPRGVVEFFLEHHSDGNIRSDIEGGYVYVAQVNQMCVGTVTLRKDEINRLFVELGHQKKGVGTAIMDFSEELLFQNHDRIQLHSSLPGKSMYLKRGYKEVEYWSQEVGYGDWICVDILEKIKAY